MSKLTVNMEPGYMALSIYYQWMSSRCGSVLESQPIQENEMSVKEYYHQFCVWKNKLEAVNYVGDEESYVGEFIWGLKKGLWVRMLRYKWIRKLPDALRRAEIEEIFLSWEENPVLIDDEEFENELQGVEVVSNEKIDEIVVQLDEDSGKIVSPNAHDKVLDELPKPAFTMTAAYVLIDDKLELNSHTGAPPNRVIEYSEHNVLNLLNKSTGLLLTGLNSSPEKLIPVEFVMVKNAYQMFDKMLQLTLGWPYEELNGNKGSIPLIDCVPRVFDPGSVKGEIWRLIFDLRGRSVCYMGCSKIIKVFDQGDGIETVTPVSWRFDPVSTRFHMFDKMPKQISLDQTKGKSGKVFMLIFDPGGHLSYHNGCSFFKPIHFNTLDKMPNQLSKNFQLEQE